MGGYEKEPDYGGPDPSWKEAVVLAGFIAAVTGLLMWLAD
jgi:hypothetical protein